MSLFSKSSYVYLASVGRDIISDVTKKNSLSHLTSTRHVIFQLADAFEKENPYGFDKERFLNNVFYPEKIKLTENEVKDRILEDYNNLYNK